MELSTSTPLKFQKDSFDIQHFNTNLMGDEEDEDGNEKRIYVTDNIKTETSTCQEKKAKGTRFLSAKAVQMLNKWFMENKNYPYPDEATTELLSYRAEISSKQVKKWFANKRVRSQLCCKAINRNIKKTKSEYQVQELNQQHFTQNSSRNHMTQSSPLSEPSNLSNSSHLPSQTFKFNSKSSYQSFARKNRKLFKKSYIRQINSDKGSIFDKHQSSANLESNNYNSPKIESQPLNNPSLLKEFSNNPNLMMNFLAATSSTCISPNPLSLSSSSPLYSSIFNKDSSPSEDFRLSRFKRHPSKLKLKDMSERIEKKEDFHEYKSLNLNEKDVEYLNGQELSQNIKNYSNFLMLMMISKYSGLNSFNLNKNNNQLNRNKSSSLSTSTSTSTSPSSFLTSTSPMSTTIEIRNSPNQSCQNNFLKNKTDFSIISTLID